MYIKLSDKKYIIPTNVIPNIETLVSQVTKKRERLIEKNQISDSDFLPFKAKYSKLKDSDLDIGRFSEAEQEYLKNKKFSHAMLTLEGDVPNVNNWSILGTIEPILGQKDKYTLHSYSNKDLPKQYRDLEEPTKCEHCDTNRKRNQTFVIKNRESDEILQVGSSCMKDFIDTKELSMLMTYANVFKELERIAKDETVAPTPTVSLINKEEFIATFLSIEEELDKKINITNYKSDFKAIAKLTLDYFNYIEYPEHWAKILNQKIDVFDKIEVLDNHLDKAELIVDFFEDLIPDMYSDKIFNLKELVGNDFDFLTVDECLKIAEAPLIQKVFNEQSEDMLNYLANYHSGVLIEGKLEILPTSFNKEDFFAALVSIGKKDENYQSNSIATDIRPSEVDKAIYMISNKHLEKQKQRIEKTYGIDKIDEFEDYISSYEIIEDDYEKVKEFIGFFKSQDVHAETSYQKQLIETVLNDDTEISEIDARKVGFAYRFYKQKSEALDLKNKISEKEKKGLMSYIGATKDRFEEIELKYINRKAVDSDFGLFYIHNMEDIYGNSFAATSQMKNPFNDESEIKDNEWIKISGTIKGHRKSNIKIGYQNIEQKQTQLNRIKPLGNFSKNPTTDGEPIMKGKYTFDEIEIKEHKKEGEFHLYKFNDKNENEYSFITKRNLNLEENTKIEAGFMLSGNNKDIYKIERNSIKTLINFTKNEKKEFTLKQLEKIIKENEKIKKDNKVANKLN